MRHHEYWKFTLLLELYYWNFATRYIVHDSGLSYQNIRYGYWNYQHILYIIYYVLRYSTLLSSHYCHHIHSHAYLYSQYIQIKNLLIVNIVKNNERICSKIFFILLQNILPNLQWKSIENYLKSFYHRYKKQLLIN